jgi:hypothetical protein
MSMHFEREPGETGKYTKHSVIELRTDTRLAARLIATREGLTILVAEGFEVGPHRDVDMHEVHLEIRESENKL